MAAKNDVFSFKKDTKPEVTLKNFWPPEDGFVWSTSSWCQISLPQTALDGKKGEIAEIALDLDVFKAPPDLEGQNVFIYVNGLRLASRFITDRVTVLVEVQLGIPTTAENIITIDTPDAAQPSTHGQGDTRRLGVQLFSLQLRRS
jgi:hypothetical protein